MKISESQLRNKVRKALRELLGVKPKSKDAPSLMQTMLGGSGDRSGGGGGGGGGGGYYDDYYDYYGDYAYDDGGDDGDDGGD